MEFKENVIEWITGDKVAYVTLSQKKHINRVRNMAEKWPSCVKIEAENKDGSITAIIPLSAIHLTIYASNKAGFAALNEEE